MKKIALEEHFSGPGFGKYMNVMKGLFEGEILASMEELLSDFDEQRLKAMDEEFLSNVVFEDFRRPPFSV